MNTFLLVFNALPAILQSIQAVETAIPLPQSGQHKLNIILGVAESAWEMGQIGQQIPKANALTAIQTITNLAVAGFNQTGAFKHSTPVLSK